jgi:methanogenic corrinoid protein MtbC1
MFWRKNDLSDITLALADIDESKVLEVVDAKLSEGVDPEELINELRIGMEKVGEKFSTGEYFLSQLVMAAEIFKAAMKKIEPLLQSKDAALGRILIGTANGDIHDLGKNIVISLLKCAGFIVYDIGVDVHKETFIEKLKELKPEILAMAGVMPFTRLEMKEVVELLEEAGLRKKVKVIIGGPFIDEDWGKDVGADAYCSDAYRGVELAKKLMEETS